MLIFPFSTTNTLESKSPEIYKIESYSKFRNSICFFLIKSSKQTAENLLKKGNVHKYYAKNSFVNSCYSFINSKFKGINGLTCSSLEFNKTSSMKFYIELSKSCLDFSSGSSNSPQV